MDRILERMDRLWKNVKKCSKVIKQPDKNDICLNGVGCFEKQIIPLRSGSVHKFRIISCQCPALNFKYQCTKMYCTLDKYSCDHLKMNIPKLKNKIKSCNNSKSLIKTVYSISHLISKNN